MHTMRANPPPPAAASRGIALIVEVVLVVGILALLIAITSGLYTHELDTIKSRQAADMIATFDRATRVYAEACGDWPPGTSDSSLRRTLPALLSIPQSRDELHTLSPDLLFTVDGFARCRDPWGQPIRCLTIYSDSREIRDRVARNDGVPVFECRGPDRQFGDKDSTRQADNIRSDEPMIVPGPEPVPATTRPAAP
jgi:hypothetical protein